jgi:ribonuclease E
MVDHKDVYQTLRTFILEMAPRHVHALKLYKDNIPIFTRYQLEDQIDRIYSERVPLKSGGSIVINPTEALVSIDVNSGRCTSGKELEETAQKTNLEAADEIARQLRLRDLGGLIVIDFIDMKDKKHQKEVEQALKQSLKKDKARVTVGHLSKFGLLELSRQRLRPSAEVSAYIECPTCQGRGRVKRVDTQGLSLLRQISTHVAQNPIQEVKVAVPLEVGIFLLNKKRKDILDLEEHHNIKIVVTPKEGLGPEDIQVEYLKREAPEVKPGPEAKPLTEVKGTAETKPAAEAKPRRTSPSRRRGPRKSATPAPAAAEAPETVQAPTVSGEPQESREPQETLVPHPEPHDTESS